MFVITIYFGLSDRPSNIFRVSFKLQFNFLAFVANIDKDNNCDCHIQKINICLGLKSRHNIISFFAHSFSASHIGLPRTYSLLIFVCECNKFLFRSQNDDKNQILRVNAVCRQRKKKGPRQKVIFHVKTLFSRTLRYIH